MIKTNDWYWHEPHFLWTLAGPCPLFWQFAALGGHYDGMNWAHPPGGWYRNREGLHGGYSYSTTMCNTHYHTAVVKKLMLLSKSFKHLDDLKHLWNYNDLTATSPGIKVIDCGESSPNDLKFPLGGFIVLLIWHCAREKRLCAKASVCKGVCV